MEWRTSTISPLYNPTKKSSFRVSLEAVRNALGETQKEEAHLRPLPSVITRQLLTFPEMIALQLQIDTNAQGLESCVGSHEVA